MSVTRVALLQWRSASRWLPSFAIKLTGKLGNHRRSVFATLSVTLTRSVLSSPPPLSLTLTSSSLRDCLTLAHLATTSHVISLSWRISPPRPRSCVSVCHQCFLLRHVAPTRCHLSEPSISSSSPYSCQAQGSCFRALRHALFKGVPRSLTRARCEGGAHSLLLPPPCRCRFHTVHVTPDIAQVNAIRFR